MIKSKIAICLATSALTLGTFLFVASCHKKDNTTSSTSEDTGYAADQMVAEKSYSDAESIANVAAGTASGSTMAYRTTATTVGGCATITHSGDSIIVNFGATDCPCADGHTRRGSIIITYSGAYADSGSTHTITFDGYYQDDNAITGTKTVTNMGHNASGQPYFNVTIAGTVTRTTGTVITANWTRVRTWLTGSTTATWTDDSYSISGSGTMTRTPSGGTTTDIAVAISTSNPLIVAYGCRWTEAGTITYTLSSGATRSIDYGPSTAPVCNNTATLTWAGGSMVITLP